MHTKLRSTYWENNNAYEITIYILRKQQCIRNYYLHIEKTTMYKKLLSTYWENNNVNEITICILRTQQCIQNYYLHIANCLTASEQSQPILCGPRITAGEVLSLVTHLASYRGSKNCT